MHTVTHTCMALQALRPKGVLDREATCCSRDTNPATANHAFLEIVLINNFRVVQRTCACVHFQFCVKTSFTNIDGPMTHAHKNITYHNVHSGFHSVGVKTLSHYIMRKKNNNKIVV